MLSCVPMCVCVCVCVRTLSPIPVSERPATCWYVCFKGSYMPRRNPAHTHTHTDTCMYHDRAPFMVIGLGHTTAHMEARMGMAASEQRERRDMAVCVCVCVLCVRQGAHLHSRARALLLAPPPSTTLLHPLYALSEPLTASVHTHTYTGVYTRKCCSFCRHCYSCGCATKRWVRRELCAQFEFTMPGCGPEALAPACRLWSCKRVLIKSAHEAPLRNPLPCCTQVPGSRALGS